MELELNGQQAYAYTGGKPFDAALPCVVFIHGAQNDHSVWGLQSRWFAHHGFAVLAVDLPGHGRSAGAPLPSIEALADWIELLLEKVGAGDTAAPGKVTLVGHSMGSLTALECAARHPARIARIALVGTAVPMPVSDALLGASKRLMERQQPGVLHNDLAACNAYTHGMEAAAALACPALIVSGSRDMMTHPKAAAKLAAAIPQATSVSLEGAGHALMAEQPDAVLDALRGFIA